MIITGFFDLNQTIASDLFIGHEEKPWKILLEISQFIIKLGNKLSPEQYNNLGNDIWIAKNANISETAFLTGPLIIDSDAEIRHNAYIRGNVIIGKNTVVGNSTELKNSILFNNVQVPHYNYVGDSVLGYKAHMGAGSITSNVKSDKSNVLLNYNGEKIDTGLKKFGAFIGDYVEIGCNSVLNPGTIIGKNSSIYPLSSVRGFIPQNSIYKSATNIVQKINR